MLFTGIGALLIITIASYFLRQNHRWSGDLKKSLNLLDYLYFEKKAKRGKNGPLYTVKTFIGVVSKSNVQFMITKEKSSDRILKKLGISSEFQTGDSDFDHKFYICCDNNEINKSIALSNETRHLIKQIFQEHDIKCLIHSKGKLWVEHELDTSIDNVEKIVEVLHKILPIFNKIHISFSAKILDKNNFKASVMMGFHSAALIIGIGGVIVGIALVDILDWSKLLKISALTGILVCISWFVAITLVMNKSSRINLVLADFVIIGIAGIFLTTYAAIVDYNVEYDESLAEIHQQVITNKNTYRCGKKRRSTCYKIYIQDWENPQKSISFKVGSGEYSKAQIGSYMTLDVRQGKIGVRWVKSRSY